jgi:hypothetical protein
MASIQTAHRCARTSRRRSRLIDAAVRYSESGEGARRSIVHTDAMAKWLPRILTIQRGPSTRNR